ncbi:hypothetical protein KCU99_g3564, partial [Aureobasidium melanogenum]
MNPRTSFSSLPPEIVTKICRDSGLRRKDLVALRLTSKSQGIHLSASKALATLCFKNINLVYTRYSLQAFADICKHPVYGPAVRTVSLSYARFVPDSFEEESKDLLNHIERDEWSQGRHKYLENIRLLVNRCDEEEDLKRSGDGKDLLATAFAALSQWQHPLEIAASSTEFGAIGRSQIYSPYELSIYAHWECDILGTVGLLCDAAVRASCAVQALEIEGVVWDNLVDSSSDSLSSLAQLSELKLDIWPGGDVDILQVAGLDGMASKLLENAVHLKTLYLRSDHIDDNTKFVRKICSRMSKMNLETITLVWIDLDEFKPFKNQIESLRYLELLHCKIDGSLKNVLLSIQKNFPRLEYLRLSGISRAWTSKEIELKGVQGVSEGIDKLMQSRQNRYNDPEAEVWDSDED